MHGKFWYANIDASEHRTIAFIREHFGYAADILGGWRVPELSGNTLTTFRSTYNTRERANSMTYGAPALSALAMLLGSNAASRGHMQLSKMNQKAAFGVLVKVEFQVRGDYTTSRVWVWSEAEFESETEVARQLRGNETPFEGDRHWAVDDLVQKLFIKQH